MLTLDLVRVQESGDNITPRYLDPHSQELLETARTLTALYAEHQGKTRQELDETLQTLNEAGGKEMMVWKGLNKLLEDRCEFDIATQIDPTKVRQVVFELSSQAHRDSKFTRDEVLHQAAQSLQLPVALIEAVLFADLKQNQVIREFKPVSAEHLLERYNTALAQAVLFRATSLRISIQAETPLRYRQLFRAIKFCRLLYLITGDLEQGFTIVLDGPLSLFQGCQKYGIQMALFLPALLLCHNWQLDAQLRWGKNNRPRRFRLAADRGLTSHYPDTGMYVPPEIAIFEERFRKLESAWDITSDCDFLWLGPQEVCIPDYALHHRLLKQTWHLEIFGFWRKAALEKRIRRLNESHVPLLLAVSDKLRGDEQVATFSHDQIYFFHEVINPREIENRLDSLLCK